MRSSRVQTVHLLYQLKVLKAFTKLREGWSEVGEPAARVNQGCLQNTGDEFCPEALYYTNFKACYAYLFRTNMPKSKHKLGTL